MYVAEPMLRFIKALLSDSSLMKYKNILGNRPFIGMNPDILYIP